METYKIRIEDDSGQKVFHPETEKDCVIGLNEDLDDISGEITKIKEGGYADNFPIGSIVHIESGCEIPPGYEEIEFNCPQDNLLINSDFRSGIINQKGQSGYEGITKAQYTIDMWILEPKGRDTSLYPQSGKLAIYQDGTNQDFNIAQHVYGLTLNQEYHLHFRYNDIDYDCNLIANSTSHNVKVNDNIDVLLSKVDSKYTLAINFRNQQSNFIEFIKLEKGSFFTGMPLWNRELELIKCMSRLQNVYTIAHNNGDNLTFTIDYMFPVEMRKKPSTTITRCYRTDDQEVGDNYVKTLVSSSKNISTMTLAKAETSEFLNIDIVADSYDY